MTDKVLNRIAIYGNGLAGLLTATALRHALPSNVTLVLVGHKSASSQDLFYGSVTSPSIYDFFLKIGLTEPDVLLKTSSSFSLGTHYKAWGPDKREWIQSFHIPLPLFGTVGFHHYIKKLSNGAVPSLNFADHIMSVEAAKRGVFAHPPEGQKIPLAAVEYGYHFLPSDWSNWLSDRLKDSDIKHITGELTHVNRHENHITSITLEGGETIEADLFIDCGRQDTSLSAPNPWLGSRRLFAAEAIEPMDVLEGVCRTLTATDSGWMAMTPLQGKKYKLSLHQDASHDGVSAKIGRSEKAWRGNCVTIGHGAALLEPLTPAPLMGLQRDIERLLELLPISPDMSVEQREYNRRFADDYDHAALFHRAFFDETNEPSSQGSYWDAACAEAIDTKLKQKITQFESRGIFVSYDYEPFSAEDWAMLHFGLGREPQRYDPLADRIPNAAMAQRLAQMRQAISQIAKKMPPHQTYMTGLLKYLKEKHG
jgi:tryptophan halogenase